MNVRHVLQNLDALEANLENKSAAQLRNEIQLIRYQLEGIANAGATSYYLDRDWRNAGTNGNFEGS